jgi:hypothetical protein
MNSSLGKITVFFSPSSLMVRLLMKFSVKSSRVSKTRPTPAPADSRSAARAQAQFAGNGALV